MKAVLNLQSLAAVQFKAPFSTGYQISKTITPVEQAGVVKMDYTVRLNNVGVSPCPLAASKRCTRPKCLARRRMHG